MSFQRITLAAAIAALPFAVQAADTELSTVIIKASKDEDKSATQVDQASMNSLRSATSDTATLLPDGTVLVAGGYDNGIFLSSAELYNPASGTWTVTNSMNTPRGYHTATLLSSGKVLVLRVRQWGKEAGSGGGSPRASLLGEGGYPL